MKAYLMTTATIFGLLTIAHIWRVAEEGAHVAENPWWIGITVLAAAMCLWAVRLLGKVSPSP